MEATGTSYNSSVRDEASQDTNPKETMTDSVTPPESTSTTTVMRNKNNNAPPPSQHPSSLATLPTPRISTEDPPPAYSAQPDHTTNGHIKPHHNHGEKSYKGFPTQEAYLAALHEWAETQKYLPVGDNGVEGFYGTTTLEEYARKEPKVEVGFGSTLRRKMKWRRR
ncbi:hypothetical protein KC330_g5627 [Hortaea werneckii]|nr:hypothetical protein KC330_g5627 [Hortaea werneckii]